MFTFTTLFARVFSIVGVMLLITAIAARKNKAFETAKETWLTIGGTFLLLFAIMFFSNAFPFNLILVALFSALVGWEIGPAIEFYGKRFKLKKYLKQKGVTLKKNEIISPEIYYEFEQSLAREPHTNEWHTVVSQALFGTAIAVLSTALVVFLTGINFGFLGAFLFIALLILIVMGILNIFIFKSTRFSLIRAYFGVVIFTLYLLYDFDRLEKLAYDETWGTAVSIAVNIYLDIINLFLSLLEILAESD